jgi:transaldolase
MAPAKTSHFFNWMTQQTPTLFWHDSAIITEIEAAMGRGATGVTCNPVIALRRIKGERQVWAERSRALAAQHPQMSDPDRALLLVNRVVQEAAQKIRPVFDRTGGKLGLAVVQVNPQQMDEAEPMIRQAIEAVKVPATAAGMEVTEALAERGITTITTVSFTVAQALAAQEAYERGRTRGGNKNDHAINYSVMIIGRLDEYLLDKAKAEGIDLPTEVIETAGLAVTKKINALFAQRGYRGMCLIGGTRQRHISQLAGSRMCMTVGQAAQEEIGGDSPQLRSLGLEPVAEEVTQSLRDAFPEFNQAYDEEGLAPESFTSFPPCRKMHDWFVESFDEIIDFVREHR